MLDYIEMKPHKLSMMVLMNYLVIVILFDYLSQKPSEIEISRKIFLADKFVKQDRLK